MPLDGETHSGKDMAIFPCNLQAHLTHGVQEQICISHVMALAGCLEPYTDCSLAPPAGQSSAVSRGQTTLLFLLEGTIVDAGCDS